MINLFTVYLLNSAREEVGISLFRLLHISIAGKEINQVIDLLFP